MPNWHRRSILATGIALSTSGAFTSTSATTEERTDDVPLSVSTGDPDGWSSEWGNAGNTNYYPLDDEFPEPGTVAWRYDLPSFGTWHDGTVAVVDGRIYLLTSAKRTDAGVAYQSELHALDADDGELDWKTEVEATGRPAVVNGSVYVTNRGHVIAFDTEDGSVRWERELTTGEWVTNPTPAAGALYVVAGDTLYALDGDDGSIRWQREAVAVRGATAEPSDSVSTSFDSQTVAVAGGTVYAITAPCDEDSSDPVAGEGGIAALNAMTGETEWAIVPEGGVTGSLMATEAFVLARKQIDDTEEIILDPDTGDVVQRDAVNTVAATSEARVTHDTWYPGDGPLSVRPYGSGAAWTVSDVRFPAPLLVGKTLIAFHDSAVTGFDLETGSVTWRWEGDPLPRAFVAVDENTLYAGHEGELVALRPADDEEDGLDEQRQSDTKEENRDDTEADCPRESAESPRADQ
ncbi:PQQ-binding-like beta-propeller repeat protein [Natrinema sp. 74]|uniref:PQQ-binding-like beta-propeller repeat protein n=1 Tax=Natrinema sp. 74 TaxID=3384159 RepID=UPI0038D42DBC